MTFTKHFEEILERCNQKFHRLRILVNKKWGPSPSTILQIYKQCVRPIFEYGIVSTIIVSETVITKIQRVQNSFIRLALRLPKYVSARLLHEASGLPYVRERLVTVDQNHLARMHANPLVKHTINSARTNIAWDKYKTPISSILKPPDWSADNDYKMQGNQVHSPHEIIITMGKTGQDARWKRKPCREVFIHINNKSAWNKLKNVSIESSKILCLNGILFCSKFCKFFHSRSPLQACLLSSWMGLGHEASK